MPSHHRDDKEIRCFDCKQMIRAGGVKPDNGLLRCESCHDRVLRVKAQRNPPAPKRAGTKVRAMLAGISFLFSFMVLTALNMLTFCMT